MDGGVSAALSVSPAFVLRCVTTQSDAELLLEVTALAQELQHLVDSYGATAAQSAALSATWAHTLACTHAQPLLNAVLPLLAQAQDSCVAMEHRLVTRLRAVEAALRACVPRLKFIAAVNAATAAELETDKPLVSACRRAVAATANLLVLRLKVLCEEGGDTSTMGSLDQFAHQQLQAELSALALPPPSSSDQPPGTVLTPLAAAAAAAAAGGGDNCDAAAPGLSDDVTTAGGQSHKRQRRDSPPPRVDGGDDDMGDGGGGAPAPPPCARPVAPTAMDAAPLGVGFMPHFAHAGGAGWMHHHGAAGLSQRSILGSVSPSGDRSDGGRAPLGEVPLTGSLPPAGVADTPVAGLLASGSSPGDGSGAGAAGRGAPPDTVTPPGPVGPPDTAGQTPILGSTPPLPVAPATVLGGGHASAYPSMPQPGQRLTYSALDPEAAQEPVAEAQPADSEHIAAEDDLHPVLQQAHDAAGVAAPDARDDDGADVDAPFNSMADPGEVAPLYDDGTDHPLWSAEAQAQPATACPEPATGEEFRSPLGEVEAGAAPMDDCMVEVDSDADKEDTPPELLLGPSGTQLVGGTQGEPAHAQAVAGSASRGAAPSGCFLQPSHTQSQEVS